MKNTNMERLTARENEILELSAFGYSAKEVADQLQIAYFTVKVHQLHIHQKTGLQNGRETTVLYWTKKHNIPTMLLPESIRRPRLSRNECIELQKKLMKNRRI